MASEVSICNLSLAHLGDTAAVSSISPPDGSAQAALCAVFYPHARELLLGMYAWNFATTRAALTLVTAPTTAWAYAYAVPSDCINILGIQDPNAATDQLAGVPLSSTTADSMGVSALVPQPYVIESLADGSSAILTNQPDAVARYVRNVTDAGKFDAAFVSCLSRLLASFLAGPILKGDVGRKEAEEQLKLMAIAMKSASEGDANQMQVPLQTYSAPWMRGR